MNRLSNKPTKTISITSGKGGVGKTTLTANLAVIAAQKGNKVLLLDGDFGMANLDIVFGQKPKHNIYDVISEKLTIDEVLMEVSPNVFLIPGGSGIFALQDLSDSQRMILLDNVSHLKTHFDYLFVDTAPGISSNVLYLNSAVSEIVIVVTPDPSSLADSYALIKVLNQKYKEMKFSIVCNRVQNENEAKWIFKILSDISFKFLNIGLDFKGFITENSQFTIAAKNQKIFVKGYSETQNCQEFRHILKNLNSSGEMTELHGGMQFFWEQVFGLA